jgi:hypothetical protein
VLPGIRRVSARRRWAGEKRSRTLGLIQAAPGKEEQASLEEHSNGGARWEKRTSWRAQGWAGEKVRALGDQSALARNENEQARRDHYMIAIAAWEKGASRVNDCKAIGGWEGEKDCPGLGG